MDFVVISASLILLTYFKPMTEDENAGSMDAMGFNLFLFVKSFLSVVLVAL